MKKSIFLFFAAILCAFSMNVQATDLKGGEVVLLKPSTNWKQADARFAVYFFNNSTNKNQWVSMKAVEGETDVYYAIAPTGTWKNLIYARMNPGNSANNWDTRWNQSADLTWSNINSLFTVSNSSWDGATTTWSAKKVASTGKLTASSANVSENEAVTLTPSLTTNTAINTIQSTTYTISPSTGASVSGNTFTATAAGTYTVTATIKYRLNGYTSTSFESTVDAKTTITVASTTEPEEPATPDYITLYLNPNHWSADNPRYAVYCFGGSEEATWFDMTLAEGEESIYTVQVDKSLFTKIIFGRMNPNTTENNWDNKYNQTGDLTIPTDGTNLFTVKTDVWDGATETWSVYTPSTGEEGGDGETTEPEEPATPDYITLYLNPNHWSADNPRYAVYCFGGDEEATWFDLTLAEGEESIYTVQVDKSLFSTIIFCRMNPNTTENNWDNKYNQTGDLTIPTDGTNLFTVKTDVWDGATETWSVYTPSTGETPEPEPTELTYNVTVPAGTNACYICGNMTGWNFTEMTKKDDTHYTITIEGAKKTDGYKYASGSDWAYVEKDASGNEMGDRTYTDGNDVVAKWASVYDPDAVEQELTYSVTVPEGTLACYIAMDIDPAEGWEFTEMDKVDDTHYTFTRTGLKNKTYKYASGPGWEYVEKTAEDGEVADRTWAENDVVAKWAVVYNPNATPEPVDHTYTVAGTEVPFGTNWNAEDTNNDMVNNGDGTYTWKRDNLEFKETKEVKFKVCEDHKWDVAYPASDYVLNIEKGYYTITITYTPADNNKVEATAEKTGEYNGDAPTHTYTIAGSAALCGVAWDYAATANDMTTADNAIYTWSKTGVEVKGNLEFKVFEDHSNSTAYPSNNWVINPADYKGAAVYTVTITFNAGTKEITVAMEKTGDVTPVVYTYYLMGINDDWATGIKMVRNEANTDAEEYMLTCQPVNGEVKIKRLGDDKSEYWYGGNSLKTDEGNLGTNTSTDGGDGNIALAAGIYNFYFNATDGKLWIAAATDCVFELGDGDNSNVLVNGVTVDLTVTRSFASGKLYTLVLPFAMDNSTVTNVFGANVELYDFTSLSENNGELILSFTKQATPAIAAGTPYLIKPKTNANGFDLTGVTINTDTTHVAQTYGTTTITMQPVLSAAAEDKTNGTSQYWLAADNNLYNNVVSIKGLRVIFDVQTTKANVRARAAFNENIETGLDNNQLPISNIQKLIENGQLIIIREGVKYNVQGQVIR